MKIDFDPVKSSKNASERGLPFDAVAEFIWETALVKADERFSYPESRFAALGYVDVRLHVVCFTPTQDGIRVISFRKANQREVARYEKTFDQ